MNVLLRLLVAPTVIWTAHSHELHIIDTHVHNAFSSSESKLSYTFPKAFPDLAGRDWNISDFVAATRQHPGISAVLMELDKEGDIYSQSLIEAKLFQKVANYCRASRGFCSVPGFVASAPVTSGADVMRRFLTELKHTAPMVRAVREALWRRPTSSFVNQTYWESLKQLALHNLTLDILANRTQLADIAKLAAALPDLRINVNHVGYPNINGGTFDQEWATGLSALAALPNVYAKLSGLPQAYAGKGWAVSDFRPYIRFVLKKFGPQRTNFAGNWFVLNEFGNYSSMLAAVKQCLFEDLDTASIQEVMAGTARRLYRLDDASTAAQQASSYMI